MKDTQIIMLGTGNAGVTRCYNTCFAILTTENVLLVDADGGNGILVQLEKAGAVWVIRMVAQRMQSGKYTVID